MGSSWQVTQSGEFEQASELTGGAQLIGKTIDGWFDRVSQEQRERAINQIYDIFAAAGYGNIADLVANWTDSLPKIVAAARGTDVQTRELIKDVFKAIPPVRRKSLSGNCATTRRGMRGWAILLTMRARKRAVSRHCRSVRLTHWCWRSFVRRSTGMRAAIGRFGSEIRYVAGACEAIRYSASDCIVAYAAQAPVWRRDDCACR